jgi:hypothetical protein
MVGTPNAFAATARPATLFMMMAGSGL